MLSTIALLLILFGIIAVLHYRDAAYGYRPSSVAEDSGGANVPTWESTLNMNTIEPAICSGHAVLCQITLTTCYFCTGERLRGCEVYFATPPAGELTSDQSNVFCLWVCLSVRQDIPESRATFTKFFYVCCLCPWLSPPPTRL